MPQQRAANAREELHLYQRVVTLRKNRDVATGTQDVAGEDADERAMSLGKILCVFPSPRLLRGSSQVSGEREWSEKSHRPCTEERRLPLGIAHMVGPGALLHVDGEIAVNLRSERHGE